MVLYAFGTLYGSMYHLALTGMSWNITSYELSRTSAAWPTHKGCWVQVKYVTAGALQAGECSKI